MKPSSIINPLTPEYAQDGTQNQEFKVDDSNLFMQSYEKVL